MFLREIIHIQRPETFNKLFRYTIGWPSGTSPSLRHTAFSLRIFAGNLRKWSTQRVVEFDSCLIQQLVADIVQTLPY